MSLDVSTWALTEKRHCECRSSSLTDLGTSGKWEEKKKNSELENMYSPRVSRATVIYIPFPLWWSVLTSLKPWANANLCSSKFFCQCFVRATKCLNRRTNTHWVYALIQILFQMFYTMHHSIKNNTWDRYSVILIL